MLSVEARFRLIQGALIIALKPLLAELKDLDQILRSRDRAQEGLKSAPQRWGGSTTLVLPLAAPRFREHVHDSSAHDEAGGHSLFTAGRDLPRVVAMAGLHNKEERGDKE